HLCIEESLRVQDNDKPKGNNVAGPLVVNIKCGKSAHLKKDCKGGKFCNNANGQAQMVQWMDDDVAWWVDSGSTVHVCKDRFVKLPNLKLKILNERGIECIFVGYAEHSKAFRFYVFEPNETVLINSIIESMDAIFDKNRFSSILRPSLRISNGTEGIGGPVVTKEVATQKPEPKLRKSKRNRTSKNFGPKFQLYLIEVTRDEVSDQHFYFLKVEDEPKTFDEAMKFQDVAFWKKIINDEIDSILGNNTWVLTDLPLGCKPLGCKWIFKIKLKVDETIEKFKARLVIQGFRQKSRIDYFDTYDPVACISTIRLLITLAIIHNMIIHQMDVKTAFLNGELDEEVYMNQPQGFIMPGSERKVFKIIKSLYGLKQAPKQWHQKFDEVILSNGYLLNQADKCGPNKGVFVIKVLYEGHGGG
ncbi:zinc finger, CCHC-type containing protein, partial [Tanacetum coccineum]